MENKSWLKVEKMSLDELRELVRWLNLRIRELELTGGNEEIGDQTSSGEAPKSLTSSGKRTYRQRYTRCGNPDCQCASGDGHGPYWYAYWWEDGKVRSEYVGKKLQGVD